MIDCPNVEMRDRLPDLANESLDPSARELVLVHLTECTACTAEIEILRTTRLIMRTTTPKVNVQSIALAIPQYRASSPIAAGRTKSWAGSWRLAAAMTFLAAGLGSYAVLRPGSPVASRDSIVAHADSSMGLALTGALADMSDAELSALATDIAKIEALPSMEVEATGTGVPAILPDSIARELEIE
jgi:hypothetical protein